MMMSCKRVSTRSAIFVSDRPPRCFRCEPESLALRKFIDFDYRAVCLIWKIAPDLVEFADRIENFVYGFSKPPILMCWQAKFLEQSENLRVKIDVCAFDCAGSVKNDSEWAFRDRFWIEML